MSKDINPQKAGILTYKAKLKVITPIFIGGGDNYKISRFEYIFDEASSNIYILDLTKWTSFLRDNKILDMYIQFVDTQASEKKGGLNNMDFIKRYQMFFKKPFITEDVLRKVSKRIIKLSKDMNDFNTNDLICFIRNTEGKPYIPGSSIKGALRSAFMSYAYKSNSSIAQRHERDIAMLFKESDTKKIRNKLKDKTQEKILFNYKALIEHNTEQYEKTGDILSFIRVSDSSPFDEQNLFISKKYDHVYIETAAKQMDKINSMPVFREYVLPGTEVEFEISIDLFNLKNIKTNNIAIPQNIEDIFKALMCKWNDLYGQKGIMNKFPDIYQYIPVEACKDTKGLLMIGGGTGFHSKSVISSISNNEQATNITKQILDIIFPPNKKRKPHVFDKPISPRAVKLVRYGKNAKYVIPGICRIITSG